MLRKPMVVHSKMDIFVTIFSQPQLEGSSSILCFSKQLHHFVACKRLLKYVVYRWKRQEECFLSGDAPFVKTILLHVFTFVPLYMALYITTKYYSHKSLSSSYISLFHCTDASFTNTFLISGKSFNASQVFLLLPNINNVVSQPLRT